MKRTPLARRTPLRSSAVLPRSPLRRVSRRRAGENRERRKVVAAIADERGVKCAVPWCDRVADDPHEPLTRARGGSITDPANIALVCRPHHHEITDEEPQWAYDLGLLRHSWERAS